MQRPTIHASRNLFHFTFLLLLLRLLLIDSPAGCQEVKGSGAVEERLDGDGRDVGGKKRRQVFREDVSPLFGGKVPSAAFDWARLMFNNLDSRGISIPDGKFTSSDGLSGGRSDEERIILFSGDMLTPYVPTTYVLRKPAAVELTAPPLNQYDHDEKVEENEDEDDEVESSPGDDYHNHYHDQNQFFKFPYDCGFQRRCSGYSGSRPIDSDETHKTQEYDAEMKDYEKTFSSTYGVGNGNNKILFQAKSLIRSEGDAVGVRQSQKTAISSAIRGAQHSRRHHQDRSNLFTRLSPPFLQNYETQELLPSSHINDRYQRQHYHPPRQFPRRYGFPMGNPLSHAVSSDTFMAVVRPDRILREQFIPIKNTLKSLIRN